MKKGMILLLALIISLVFGGCVISLPSIQVIDIQVPKLRDVEVAYSNKQLTSGRMEISDISGEGHGLRSVLDVKVITSEDKEDRVRIYLDSERTVIASPKRDDTQIIISEPYKSDLWKHPEPITMVLENGEMIVESGGQKAVIPKIKSFTGVVAGADYFVGHVKVFQ